MPIHPDTFPLPTAVVFPASILNPEIVLLRVLENRVQVKYWNGEGWSTGWSGWMDIVAPVGAIRDTGSYFTALAWIDVGNSHYRWNGFFSFQSSPALDDPIGLKTGTPWEDLFNVHWVEMTPPTIHSPNSVITGFEPRSSFSWINGNKNRLNIFGVAKSNTSSAAISVRELWWDGGTWLWNDHGRPPGTLRVTVGAQSAIWPAGNNNHYAFVFVTSHEENPAGHSHLWARYWHDVNALNWQWVDLGYPGNVHTLREPLTFSYLDVRTGKPHINVFVAGADPATNRWQLYNRQWFDGNWGGWEVWGSPPGAGAGTSSGFHLTSGVVWHDGPTLRINLFGYTEVTNPPQGNTGFNNRPGALGFLINFWWNGSNWGWGETLAPPSNLPLRTISSSGYSSNGRNRISVFARDSAGTVFERFWDTAIAQEWRWLQH